MRREGTGWQVKGTRARGVAESQSPSDRVHTNACASSVQVRGTARARERGHLFFEGEKMLAIGKRLIQARSHLRQRKTDVIDHYQRVIMGRTSALFFKSFPYNSN
jgi:hypothetical protein